MKPVNIACASDIHLGHKRNKSVGIIENLYAAFPDDEKTAALDLICLAGDVFDDLLSLNYNELAEIDFWIHHLLALCKKHDIMLRVLEGTPSHDWKQSRRFEVLNTVSGIGANLKYVKDLSIEHIEEYGITVLYVPDEWNDTTEKTLSQVKNLIRANGERMVDVAFMHGQFEFQLPEYVRAQKHSSSEYLNLVAGPIFIGHVHNHTSYDRIIAQGSFDRLSHGEENPKGHVRATYNPFNRALDWEFVPNTGAKIFKTINCTGLELNDILKEIDQELVGLPDHSHVRVAVESSSPILQNMDVLIRTFSQFIWSKITTDSKTQEETEYRYDEEADEYVPILITPDNVVDLLVERMRPEIDDSQVPTVRRLMQEIIDAL